MIIAMQEDAGEDQIQQVIAIMKLCDDMDDFKRKFAKVFAKTPLQMQLWEDVI